MDLFTFAEVEKISNLSPNVILLGAYSSPDKTLQQLDFIVKHFSQTPVLLIDAKTATQWTDRNVIACLTFPFTYKRKKG